MVSQTSLDAGSESDITLLAEESEGAAYPENMGEGVELSEVTIEKMLALD